MTWVSIHAYYHGDLDVLLREAVRPLVAEFRAAGLIDGYFFLRYWDGGPHLRVRLSTGTGRDVEARALDHLRGYLAARPSADLPGADRYPREAARRAAAEGLTDYLRVPVPNNTARPVAYRPEHHRYGYGAALAAVERHFVESSRIALGLVTAGLTRDRRHAAAFAAIILGWHGQRLRPPDHDDRYEAGYPRLRDGLHRLADQMAMVATGTTTLPAGGALRAWHRTIGSVPDPRVADLCTHLFCNRLGVGPAEERYLRYLAARTLTGEEVPR